MDAPWTFLIGVWTSSGRRPRLRFWKNGPQPTELMRSPERSSFPKSPNAGSVFPFNYPPLNLQLGKRQVGNRLQPNSDFGPPAGVNE